jgi:hypothetical protein
MPEVKTSIELVLEDPTTAVRSVLGDWLRTLLYFDREWTARHLDAIFPEAEGLKPYWQAAWRAFVEYDHPYDPAFELLKRKYELAVARLEGASDEARKQMGETGLGHHLASYYWRGVGGEGTRTLLLKYFDLCSPEAAAHVLWSLGQGLQGADPIAATTLAPSRHSGVTSTHGWRVGRSSSATRCAVISALGSSRVDSRIAGR